MFLSGSFIRQLIDHGEFRGYPTSRTVHSLLQIAHLLRPLRCDALRAGAAGAQVRGLRTQLPQKVRLPYPEQLLQRAAYRQDRPGRIDELELQFHAALHFRDEFRRFRPRPAHSKGGK